MKLKCVKTFEVCGGLFKFKFTKDVVYETYEKDNELYIKGYFIGISYEKYKDKFEIIG